MPRTTPSREDQTFRERDRRLALAMSRAQAGDADAYRVLLGEIEGMLTSYHSRSLRRFGQHSESTIQDLVQETLMAIHSKRATYDPSEPFGPWMYAIARYKLIDYGRRSRREIPTEKEVLQDRMDDGRSEAFGEAERTLSVTPDIDLERALAKLNAKTREIVIDVKLRERSIRSVAEERGMSESAVKVAVHRAIAFLRKRKDRNEGTANREGDLP